MSRKPILQHPELDSILNDVFLMIPSIEKIGSASDVWAAISANKAGELVPEAVMRLGGLAVT